MRVRLCAQAKGFNLKLVVKGLPGHYARMGIGKIMLRCLGLDAGCRVVNEQLAYAGRVRDGRPPRRCAGRGARSDLGLQLGLGVRVGWAGWVVVMS